MQTRQLSLIFVSVVVAALGPLPVSATTWGQKQVDDPIVKGARCTVGTPTSAGSYIYSWPSKYDLVFWPSTADNGIWFCWESGFTAFIRDFDGIDEVRRASIAAYLAENYVPEESLPQQKMLELLEGCYALRAPSAERNITILRTLAYHYERMGNQAAADRRRRQALAQILTALDTDLKEALRLEYLFVAAAYQRELGQRDASDDSLDRLRSALKKSSDAELAGYVEYLDELSADIPRIEPGGKLAPEKL